MRHEEVVVGFSLGSTRREFKEIEVDISVPQACVEASAGTNLTARAWVPEKRKLTLTTTATCFWE